MRKDFTGPLVDRLETKLIAWSDSVLYLLKFEENNNGSTETKTNTK